MKKKNYDLIIGLVAVVIAVVSIVVVREVTKPKPFKPLTISITEEKLVEKMNNKESFIFYVGSETCSACQAYKHIVNDFIKTTNDTVYYLDTKIFKSKEALETFYKDVLKTEASTPQTFYVKDGEIVEYFTGNVSLDSLMRFADRYK